LLRWQGEHHFLPFSFFDMDFLDPLPIVVWLGGFGPETLVGVVRGVTTAGIGRGGRLGSGWFTAGPGGEAVCCWWSAWLAWVGDWAAKFGRGGVVVSVARVLRDMLEFLTADLTETKQGRAFMFIVDVHYKCFKSEFVFPFLF
jgi:hypothetical protein